MSLDAIASAMGAMREGVDTGISVSRVTTDSRAARCGDLFFAIVGERFNGHDFIGAAGANGAVACVCNREWRETNRASNAPIDGPLLIVNDTVEALGSLGAFYRSKIIPSSATVVAITGSNGKTTTKSMLNHILSDSLRGRAAPRSFNNHLGVPLTLLSYEKDDQYLIVEIGANSPGEVARLAAMTSPDIGLITSVGEAHLEGFGGIDAIAREKASLLEHIRQGGVGVVNADRCEINAALGDLNSVCMETFGIEPGADLRVTRITTDLHGTQFLLDGRFEVVLRLPGIHHATNAAAAVAVARRMGIDLQTSIARLRTFVAADGRASVEECGGVTIVDDSYNANPVSMLAAVNTLGAVADRRRVFVMGDMFELGAASYEMHERMVRCAAACGIDVLVAVGACTVRACESLSSKEGGMQVVLCSNASDAGVFLRTVQRDGDAIWVKGSRAMGLDEVVRSLRKHVARGVRDDGLASAAGRV